ncbi:MAG: sugar kinase [Thainema sp.]
MPSQGLFIGLITLDLIYQVEHLPQANEKMVANAQVIAAGGPATNAAVTYQQLGSSAQILGVLGTHPLCTLINADLQQQQAKLIDLQPELSTPPPMSSIFVTAATGDRAVVSRNAEKRQATFDQIPKDILQGVDLVLIDGHQMAVGYAIARHAQAQNISVIIDGGSWKPGFEEVLPLADYVIASANFLPPRCETTEQVLDYLAQLEIPYAAVTHGEKPIQYQVVDGKRCDRNSLPVPQIQPVDTLGAGDIFHGAFCHFIQQQSFPEALQSAAEIAALACQSFGTREWIGEIRSEA